MTQRKTDEQYRGKLTPEQYHVTREKGTEPAFSGKHWDNKEQGVYRCVCCGAELFGSDAKYDSGTGWPSFSAPVAEQKVGTEPDNSHGMTRVEVTCKECDAHLGHLFEDGPAPAHKRFCINSAALDFDPSDE